MEDSHVAYVDFVNAMESLMPNITNPNSIKDALDEDLLRELSVFGVFDGHGGKEVAKFVQEYFFSVLMKRPDLLKSHETVGEALR